MGSELRNLRKSRGWTIDQAAEAFGLSRGGYQKLERSERQMKAEYIERAAKIYGVSEMDVIVGPPTVGVVGMIGAGGTFDTSAEQIDHAEPLYEIELPFHVGDDAIAFEIRGESMWPRYDAGDVIVCFRRSVDPETLLGWEAAVGTPDGARYLKRLLRGSQPGLYTLESHNAPPIRDVHLDWVSDVGAVVRANQVRRVPQRVQQKILRQIRARAK